MRYSKHYTLDKIGERHQNIEEIGLGKTIYEMVAFDTKRKKKFRYRFTDTGIMIVLDLIKDIVITQYPAKPNTIRRYWVDAPQWYLRQAQNLVLDGRMA